MFRAYSIARLQTSQNLRCAKPSSETFQTTTSVMPITPPYTSPFLESDEYKFFLKCVDDVKVQQDRDRIKSTEMERTRRTAKWVGLDMDTAKPKHKRQQEAETKKDA